MSRIIWIELLRFRGFRHLVICYHWNLIICPADNSTISEQTLEDALNELPSASSVLDDTVRVMRYEQGQLPFEYAIRTSDYGSKITARLKTVVYNVAAYT